MQEPKNKNSRGFKISQYVFATFMGLLAAKLAPSHKELPPSAISFVISPQLRESFSPWWEIKQQAMLWPNKESLTLQAPWIRYENGKRGTRFTLTRDHFRCKGNAAREPIAFSDGSYLFDCWGFDHGLPWINGREFVEPLLIELLNGVQNELDTGVLILSGHRCPAHHRYITQGKGSATDRHLIAAAADFQVRGFESDPQILVPTLQKVFNQLTKDPKRKFISYNEGWKNYFCELKWHPAGEFISLDHPAEHGYFELIITHRLDLSSVKFIPKESYHLPQF